MTQPLKVARSFYQEEPNLRSQEEEVLMKKTAWGWVGWGGGRQEAGLTKEGHYQLLLFLLLWWLSPLLLGPSLPLTWRLWGACCHAVVSSLWSLSFHYQFLLSDFLTWFGGGEKGGRVRAGGGTVLIENRRGGYPRRRGEGTGAARMSAARRGGGGAKHFFGTETPTKSLSLSLYISFFFLSFSFFFFSLSLSLSLCLSLSLSLSRSRSRSLSLGNLGVSEIWVVYSSWNER